MKFLEALENFKKNVIDTCLFKNDLTLPHCLCNPVFFVALLLFQQYINLFIFKVFHVHVNGVLHCKVRYRQFADFNDKVS